MSTKSYLSINDIKYDLLKITEPWDGWMTYKDIRQVRHMFITYMNDLQKERKLYDFSIDNQSRAKSITFDITFRLTPYRAPKTLKIHVGVFTK